MKLDWLKRRDGETNSPSNLPLQLHRDDQEQRSRISEACEDIGLHYLPNDLTRMIYLASLRDCNSGAYLHPQLSKRIGVEQASALLRDSHEGIFQRLLEMRLPDYVPQLQEYIRYSKTDSRTMLSNWKSLQAYRATVPLHTEKIWSELFFLNIEVAIAVLQETEPLHVS